MTRKSYRVITVLTGAGISQESGLKTFRDQDGLWEGHRVEEVATPEAFATDPERVHRFYNQRRAQLKDCEPNLAHTALANFEAQFSGEFNIVTQNVDDLHERGGSRQVIHMHGELFKARCIERGEVMEWKDDLSINTPHPRVKENIGTLRPHICWFGEMPYRMEEISQVISRTDLFVAIGTSGHVYPAAALVQWTSPHCRKVILNREASENEHSFDQAIYGRASEIVPRFFSRLLETESK